MKTGFAVSIEEYLTNPAYEHCEYVGGEVVERTKGRKKHAQLQVRFGHLLIGFAESKGLVLGAELHCRIEIGGETVFRLPDLALIEGGTFDSGEHLIGAPTLAIEIRSLEDRTKDVLRKSDEYLANGSKMVWVVDPEARNVLVVMGDRVPWIVEEGEELTGAPVWPDLKVDLTAAFRGI